MPDCVFFCVSIAPRARVSLERVSQLAEIATGGRCEPTGAPWTTFSPARVSQEIGQRRGGVSGQGCILRPLIQHWLRIATLFRDGD